ncbi:MAG: hypothetical protein ACAH80_00205 [Alphaproteobacteria bacterium]
MAKGWLKKFFARFYSDEPDMLMPAVAPSPEDDEVSLEQQHRAAVLHHQQNSQTDEGADDDLDLPPPNC